MPTSKDYLSNKACLSSGVRVELNMENMQHTTEEEEKRKRQSKSTKKIKIAMKLRCSHIVLSCILINDAGRAAYEGIVVAALFSLIKVTHSQAR